MRLSQARRTGRTGFTLVEVLVVIAIIAVLVGLLTSAVAKSRSKINEVRNRHDISQLAVALEAFKTKYGSYPPSRIKLAERFNDVTYPPTLRNTPGTLEHDSVQFILKMFPQILTPLPDGTPPPWANSSPLGGVDWNGDRSTVGGPVWSLEGDQCLVFFLGGIPAGGGASGGRVPITDPAACLGFSVNPRDPAYHVKNGGETIGPFFEFQTSRLSILPLLSGVIPSQRSPTHFTYLDAYGKRPFAYFSAYKQRNGYNRYYNATNAYSDCPSLVPNPAFPPGNPQDPNRCVWPLAEVWGSAPRYLKAETFQIVSAGADGKFGSGTIVPLGNPVWTPATAAAIYPDTPTPPFGFGHDDQSNYYELLLGVEGK